MPSATVRRLIWGIIAISLIWALAVGLDLFPQLRGDYGWRWPYIASPEHPERLLELAASLAIYIGGGWWLYQQRHVWPIIVWACAGGIGLTLAVLAVSTSDPIYELYTRTVTNLTTGWHYAAADIDTKGGLGVVLHTWPVFIQQYAGPASHVAVSPPGLPVAYYALSHLLDTAPQAARWMAAPLRADQCNNFRLMGYSNGQLASAWAGMLMPVWASLAALPLYWIGRRYYTEHAARLSVLWWPLIPSILMFAPHPSTAYALPTLVGVAFLVEGLSRRQPWQVAISGLIVGILTFTNFSMLPLIFFAGLITLLIFWSNRRATHLAWHWPMIMGLVFGLGAAIIWAIYTLVSGVTLWDIFRAVMSTHLTLDRPYLPWLYLHLNDYGMFTGWPPLLVAVIGIWQTVRAMRRQIPWSVGQILAVAAPATLIATDLSGIGRGESGRIWVYLSPLILLVAADVLTSQESRKYTWMVTAAQAIMVLTLVTFVHVIDSGLSAPPDSPPPPKTAASTVYLDSGAVFDDALRLNRFAGQVETLPGTQGKIQPTLVLWLEWQSSGQVDKAYYLSLIPVAPGGEALSASVIQPFGSQYPTTCWRPINGVITDRVEVPLNEQAAKGDWWVSLSLIDGRTGQKPPVVLPDGSQDEQVGIGPFR